MNKILTIIALGLATVVIVSLLVAATAIPYTTGVGRQIGFVAILVTIAATLAGMFTVAVALILPYLPKKWNVS